MKDVCRTCSGRSRVILLKLGVLGAAMIVGCSSSDDDNNTATPTDSPAPTVDCSGATGHMEEVVCAANALLATLTEDQQSAIQYDWSDSEAKTLWSNLPNSERNGPTLGELSEAGVAAAMNLASLVLSEEGYEDFTGVLAADDYLGTLSGGGGPGGGQYSSDNYHVAFIGTPSTTGDWMLQLGGHHLAYNVTYLAGTGYPTPNHIGVEPKSIFTLDNTAYQPLSEEGQALTALFDSLDSTQLETAYLEGQVFMDVVLGPVEYNTGSYDSVVFPSGSSRTGLQVSSLSTAQQALVTAAIQQWVEDFDSEVADRLVADYTATDAYADTLVAWGGTEASGPDHDVAGTYLRIDGPRVWIEVSCQAGVLVQGETHYHAMFRDKEEDYAGSL